MPGDVVLPGDLVARVEAWVAQDPDPLARAELTRLLESSDEAGLRDRFSHPLEFGTAGLRGQLGAGPARMNRAVVRRTSAGLARYLLDRYPHLLDRDLQSAADHPSSGGLGAVVGHDARHRSAEFADDTARVLAAAGLHVLRFKSALPTPVTAFAVLHLGAAAGVVVTASHNPAPDNGYKVYVGDGAQALPDDAAAITAAAGASAVPDDAAISGPFDGRLVDVDEQEVLSAYRLAVLSGLRPSGPRRLRTVYTPLHGVGAAVLPGLFEQAGFHPPALVAAQARPDPDFPTTPFPNPEEPGVLDLALADAERLQADLVLANDPDADRLAVAVPDRGGGGYRVLTGDELGVLIGDHLMATSTGADRLVASTVVSSSMLSALASSYGVAYAETLTGFKWIARAARVRPGHRLLFGYEEALGYAVSTAVADKDGLSAAVVVAEMAARAKHEDRSLLDRLHILEALVGVHTTAQMSLRFPGSDATGAMASLMAHWRSAPPGHLGGLEVDGVRDLAHGGGELPASDVLVLRLGGLGRVVLRPSGTEPKLKVYLEATTGPCALEDLPEARRAARASLEELRQDVASYIGAR
ncbi:MAG: phospho-sugar mutase [Acidimicrobiales bacterium]|jgi:phosphomannomutase